MMNVTKPWRSVGIALVGIVLIAGCPIDGDAQEENQQDRQELETRVFDIEHYSSEFELRPIMNIFQVMWSFDERLKTLLVRAPGELMPAIARVVERLDVPAPRTPSVELTMHILLASEEERQEPLPPTLDAVTEQLRSALPYQSFSLMETAIVRGVNGEALSIQGVLPLQTEGVRHHEYQMRGALHVTSASDESRVVRFENFSFSTQMRVGGENHNIQISTSIEIAEGQQAVVGKAAVGDSALILVMSTKLIN